MLELGSSGSVRGVLSNEHPYRHPRSTVRITGTTPRGHVCDALREAARSFRALLRFEGRAA